MPSFSTGADITSLLACISGTTQSSDAMHFFDGRMGLFIGSNANIGDDVRIFTLEHDITSSNFAIKGGAVYIDDWVYIGARVTILPSVRIGRGRSCSFWSSRDQGCRALDDGRGRSCKIHKEKTHRSIHAEYKAEYVAVSSLITRIYQKKF